MRSAAKWAGLAVLLMALLAAPALAAEKARDDDSKASKASSKSGCKYCHCDWVTITVSDDDEVWWTNEGRSFAPYLRFAKAEIPRPRPAAPGPPFESVYFDLDKSFLRPEGMKTTEKVAAYLKANPEKTIRVEGNCCDLATNPYNIKLGMRRAESVKKYLVELGIDADRIETVSYGEERRVTTTPQTRPLNRRADFKVEPKEAEAKE